MHPRFRTLASATAAATLLVVSCSESLTAPTAPTASVQPSVSVDLAALLGTTVYASEVVAFSQGLTSNGSSVELNRSNPLKALGAPDSDNATLNFVSLGYGGSITLKLPTAVTGALVLVFETTFADPTYPEEKADVYVSKDNVTFVLVGRATNQVQLTQNDHKSTFTLPDGCWQYVKIVDRSVLGSYDAFDVDAVAVENAIPCTNGCGPGFYSTHDVPGDEATFASYGINSGPTGTGYANTYTLEQALDNPNGGPSLQDAKNVLLRQTAAALLNAGLVVGYPKTAAEITALVNAALLTGSRPAILALSTQLDAWNSLTCVIESDYPHE